MRGSTEGAREEKHFFSQRRRWSCWQDERTRVAALQGVLGNRNHMEPLTMDANMQKILFNDWIFAAVYLQSTREQADNSSVRFLAETSSQKSRQTTEELLKVQPEQLDRQQAAV